MRWLPLRLFCLAAVLISGPPAAPQTPATAKTDAQLDDEATQAQAFYDAHQLLKALPLYEELHAARPQRVFYTERLAMTWVAKAGAESSPEATAAANKHALQLFKEAEAAGDHSDLAQIMIEKLSAANAATPAPAGPVPEWREAFNQAEILFSKGDLKGALALYEKSWKENPQFYSAPLFAGDSEFKLGDCDAAGVWYQRAIAISPDTETAHRYWADCLTKAGKTEQARKEYIEAFIADPYQKAPRLQLHTWAARNQLKYVAPPIELPAAPARGKDGHINITIDPSGDKDGTAAAMAFSLSSTVWQMKKFSEQYPNEKAYRHTLKEEMDGLQAMLEVFHRQKVADDKLTPTARSLLQLEKDGMLECWILIDNPDNGTAQDYAAFRATHRDLLRAYIEKYDLHPA